MDNGYKILDAQLISEKTLETELTPNVHIEAEPVNISVERVDGGAIVTMTDVRGSTQAMLKDGYTPVKGKDYFDGEDGYTPVKGIDYFDGENGKDGYTPVKGVDYTDGRDGIDGKDGLPGADGHTPEKGVDYFTSADIDEVAERAAGKVTPYDDTEIKGEISNLKEDIVVQDRRISDAETVIETKADKDALEETDRSLDALWKLSKGQLWDIEQVECEGHAQLPSGGEYGNVDEVRGKTEQDSTNGYQLLDSLNDSISESGLTFTNNGDGSFSLTGTSTKTQSFAIKNISVKSGTYTLSSNIAGTNGIYLRVRDENNITNAKVITSGTSGSITVDTDTDLLVQIFVIGSDVTVNNTWYPMLEPGSVAHPYEKFSGGIPAPNPEFPEAIHSVEGIEIKKSNRDFIGIIRDANIESNGRIVSNSQAGFSLLIFRVNKGHAYRASVYAMFNELPTIGSLSIDGIRHLNETLVLDSNYIIIRILNDNTSTNIYIDGVSKTYKYSDADGLDVQSRTIIPPRPLNAIGEYKDKCDVIKGEWVYQTSDVIADKNSTGGLGYVTTFNASTKIARVIVGMNNDLIGWNANGKSEFGRTICTVLGNTDWSRAERAAVEIDVQTIEEAKDKLDGVRFVSPILKELSEPINPADLEWLRNLTLLPSENLFITDNHGRDVSYLMSDFINLGKVGG